MRVSSIGELLVDMVPQKTGRYVEGVPLEAHLGGSPFNYAVILSELGAEVYGFGAAGKDELGKMLLEFIRDCGVGVESMKLKDARTSIAFITLSESGERSFFFYREPWVRTADTMFSIQDIEEEILLSSEILYVSGMALSVAPLRDAVLHAMKLAKENDLRVLFDYNLRWDVWSSREDLERTYEKALKHSDIISISIDELQELYGTEDYESLSRKLLKKYCSELFCVKLGERGSYVRDEKRGLWVDSFKVRAVDTTGAGDSWNAAFTFYHLLSGEDLKSSMTLANAVGALTVSSRGAAGRKIKKEELEEFASSYSPEFRVI